MHQGRIGGGQASRLLLSLAAAVATAWLAEAARAAQLPGEAGAPAASAERDLITRFRFRERYSLGGGRDGESGTIGQYRVGIRATHSLPEAGSRPEAPGGPPRTSSQQVIYTDRPAEISSLGQVKSLVRRYDKAKNTPATGSKLPAPESIEGLTVLFRNRLDGLPQILSLTGGRSLTEDEYRFAASQMFVPGLSALLPPRPVRVGDSWPISKPGVRALVQADKVLEGGLVGKLLEVRNDTGRGGRLAVFEVTGRTAVQSGPRAIKAGVRAQLQFAFATPQATEPDSGPAEEGMVDAPGAIVRLSMAVAGTTASAGDRKAQDFKREFLLERQVTNAGPPLSLPQELPAATPENSWLLSIDPRQRFRFRHPQELQHPGDLGIPAPEGPDRIELVQLRLGGGADAVRMEFSPNGQRKPEEVHQALLGQWKSKGIEVLQGATGWLPDSQWPGKRVYRIEAAFVTQGRSTQGVQRIHFDGYVVHFGQNASLVVEATTSQDPPIRFRDEVEAMLKTFRMGPPESP